MDYTVLLKCNLFSGLKAADIQALLETIPHSIRQYGKAETVFRLLDTANHVGIVLQGRVQAQKTFPNGSQGNVSVKNAGEIIGAAATFSKKDLFPCDIIALEPSDILMISKDSMLLLMQKDIRILDNFTAEIATATYMLQQKLELLSYSGIAQKAAFYLLKREMETGKQKIRIPGSMSEWALSMNVSRPSLHRELKKLENDGVLVYAPPFIEILDKDALQDVLGK